MKRELEAEAKLAKEQESECSQLQSPKQSEFVASPLLACRGVFFKCPMVSGEVLTKDEWKVKIKEFLYEQLEAEPALTACLIVQSCNSNREKVKECVDTLCKYLENIINHPDEEKYQRIRMSNRVFCDKVQPIEGSSEVLHAAGFRQEKCQLNDQDEDFLVFHLENVDSLESLRVSYTQDGTLVP